MTTTILPTQNTDRGFWGTMRQVENPAADADNAWEIASHAIAWATAASREGVRDFLDSRYGRHFADDVANELFDGATLERAIEAAVTRWMGWRIGRGRPNASSGSRTGFPISLASPTITRSWPNCLNDGGASAPLTPRSAPGCAARGGRRVGMVPALAWKGPPDDQAFRHPARDPVRRRSTRRRQRAAAPRIVAGRRCRPKWSARCSPAA